MFWELQIVGTTQRAVFKWRAWEMRRKGGRSQLLQGPTFPVTVKEDARPKMTGTILERSRVTESTHSIRNYFSHSRFLYAWFLGLEHILWYKAISLLPTLKFCHLFPQGIVFTVMIGPNVAWKKYHLTGIRGNLLQSVFHSLFFLEMWFLMPWNLHDPVRTLIIVIYGLWLCQTHLMIS